MDCFLYLFLPYLSPNCLVFFINFLLETSPVRIVTWIFKRFLLTKVWPCLLPHFHCIHVVAFHKLIIIAHVLQYEDCLIICRSFFVLQRRPPDNSFYVRTCNKNPKKTKWWYHGKYLTRTRNFGSVFQAEGN